MKITRLFGAQRAGTQCGSLWFDAYFFKQGSVITSARRTDKDVVQVAAVLHKLPIHDYQFVINYEVRAPVVAALNGSGGAVVFDHLGTKYKNKWEATLVLRATELKTWKEDAASVDVKTVPPMVPPMQIDVVSVTMVVHAIQPDGSLIPASVPFKTQTVSITVA